MRGRGVNMYLPEKRDRSFEDRCRAVFDSLNREVVIADLRHQRTICRELKQIRRFLTQAEDIPMRFIFDRPVYQLKNSVELRKSLEIHDLSLLTRVFIQNFLCLGELSLGMKQQILMLIYERYSLLKIPARVYSLEIILESAKLERDFFQKKIQEMFQNKTAREFQPFVSRMTHSERLAEMQVIYRGIIPLAEAIRQSRQELYDANEEQDLNLRDFFQGGGKPVSYAGVGSSVNFDNRLKHLMLENVKAGDMFLDIGCGVGAQSYALLQRGAKVVMNEMDAKSLFKFMEVVEDMRQATGDPFDFDLSFLSYGSFFDIAYSYKDRSFDGILCNHILHYMTPGQIQEMFKEMYRLVKPGGHIYVSVLTPYHFSFKYITYDLLNKQKNHKLWPGVIRNTDKAWFSQMGIDPLYNPMRVFPRYMHPQSSKILDREARRVGFEVVESGYFGFPSDSLLLENDPRGTLFKKFLTEGEIGETVLSLYRKDKSIAYLVATRK